LLRLLQSGWKKATQIPSESALVTENVYASSLEKHSAKNLGWASAKVSFSSMARRTRSTQASPREWDLPNLFSSSEMMMAMEISPEWPMALE
jgi:hypothetical protein